MFLELNWIIGKKTNGFTPCSVQMDVFGENVLIKVYFEYQAVTLFILYVMVYS
mgnify:CR=1 FL=1